MDNVLKNRLIAFMLCLVSCVLVFVAFILIDNNVFSLKKNNCGTAINNNENLLSESDAISIGNKLHEDVGDLFVTHGLRDCDTVYSYNYFKMEVASNYDTYVYCKLKYDENRQVLSSNGFLELVKYADAISSQGEFYILAGDRGANISYQGFELKVVSIEENKITFKVDELYYDLEYGEEAPSDKSLYEVKTNDFVIVKEDNTWKVDSYTVAY